MAVSGPMSNTFKRISVLLTAISVVGPLMSDA